MARFIAVLRFIFLLIIGDKYARKAWKINHESDGEAARAIREIRERRAITVLEARTMALDTLHRAEESRRRIAEEEASRA